MRTLVEQTRKAVETWLRALLKSADEIGLGADSQQQLRWLVDHSPVVLMGGEDPEPMKREWDLWPEKPCILIGTQDMLLSRALNRGYAMSRAFRASFWVPLTWLTAFRSAYLGPQARL
jgi:CRISPR-associated endonuclease/helicase Cas3